ncbi:MAG TPA: DEAD/DEAH box helicase [Candidatus Faecalibacterium intestinigallinarum]|uniref:DEAD/DEAH box helicase n=1 Tax=Candidatus Faecalibacterium intestinigallinarum TaxID=2838581 RepID=A0A9D1QAF2_9FIRM|nr:DEAD/DEAH box helicase [Candidatus Faecalibacterium intestinigallinarum]
MLRWNKTARTYSAPVTLDLLDVLAQIFPLPDTVEAERRRLAGIARQLDAQRAASEPVPLTSYPVRAKMFRHQVRAANMALIQLSSKPSAGFGLLFEMGCGKTLTAIAIMGALYCQHKITRVLVVAPSSVCSVWPHDLAAFAAFPYEVRVLLGEKKQRLEALHSLTDYPNTANRLLVAVINYEATHREGIFEALEGYAADLIVCDESQRIKNPRAAQSRAVQMLGDNAACRLILSGTPVQNSVIDLYSQYRFLDPGVFGANFYAFRNRYCQMGGYGGHEVVGYQHMDELTRKEHSIALRVTKAECLDLPGQTFVRRYVQLEPAVRRLYAQIARASCAELENGEHVTASIVLTKLLRLMQLTGGFVQADGGDRPRPAGSAKLDALADILEDYVQEAGQKLVVFARFRPEIAAICQLLEQRGIRYGRIDGEVPMDQRGAIVETFQQDPGVKVFVAQIQTAGLGITLHAASAAVFYSLDFNYANYAQALARIHRIGQAQPVTYIHLLAEHTVDDQVLDALERKEDLARTIVDGWKNYFRGDTP